MAKAQFIREVVEVVTKQEKVTGVQLTLTQEEADFLCSLLGMHVIGSGKNRKLSNKVYTALNDAGLSAKSLPICGDERCIYLANVD